MSINRREFTGAFVSTLFLQKGLKDSSDLPPCPVGFSWTFSSALKAHVPVPNEWHFYEKLNSGSTTVYSTREDYSRNQEFLTGFAVNVVPNMIDAFGGEVLLVCNFIVDVCLEGIEPLHRFRDENEDFYTYGIEKINPPKGYRKTDTRIRVVGVGNKKTKTLYLVQFESPASQWDKDWIIGSQIYDMFDINGNV